MSLTGSVPEPRPHRHRQTAQSFGADADRYDRTRPAYPAALIRRLLAASPGRAVLDAGCGTGIAARQFAAEGGRVLGVEPDERMAAFARRSGLAVEAATFESWDARHRSFDMIFSGSAWHWVDPVAGAARAAQVLPPGGLLALAWHVYQLPAEVAGAFAAAWRQVVPDAAFSAEPDRPALASYEDIFTRATDGIRRAAQFAEPRRWSYEWQLDYTRAQWLDRMPTSGALTELDPARLEAVLAATGAAIDAMGGSFTLPYTTVAVVAARSSQSAALALT